MRQAQKMRLPFYVLCFLLFAAAATAAKAAEAARAADSGAIFTFAIANDKKDNQRYQNFAVEDLFNYIRYTAATTATNDEQ